MGLIEPLKEVVHLSNSCYSLGAFTDIQFKEHYHFQGGINFASKRTGIALEDSRVGGGIGSFPQGEVFDHEYLQVPLTPSLIT